MEHFQTDEQKEILSRLTPFVAKLTQDRLDGKAIDQNAAVVFANDMIATYGIMPVCEALMTLNTGIDLLISKSDMTPPPIPDGAPKLVN